MHLGKRIRMERFFNRETGRSIIVPMDHGLTYGPMHGLLDMQQIVGDVASGGADGVLMHKGLVRCSHRGSGQDIGLIVHLSAGTSLSGKPDQKIISGSVEDAIRLGADGISVHVSLGGDHDNAMLSDLGKISAEAANWGMPLLAMVYPRGPHIKNENDPAIVAHGARIAMELGADIIKVTYTGSPESFAKVTEGCCVPIIIAGGPRMESTRQFMQMVYDSLQAGGSGISVGRNIFQYKNPKQIVTALKNLVHDGLTVEEAIKIAEK